MSRTTASIKGLDEVIAELERVGARTSEAERRLMEKSTEEIARIARDYAPVDEGNLESAIKTKRITGAGINNRTIHAVFVDKEELGEGYTMYGHRYDVMMHEDPAGNSGKGPKSQAKAKKLGVLVGPKFLERALEETRESIETAARAIAKRLGK